MATTWSTSLLITEDTYEQDEANTEDGNQDVQETSFSNSVQAPQARTRDVVQPAVGANQTRFTLLCVMAFISLVLCLVMVATCTPVLYNLYQEYGNVLVLS